MRRSIRWLLLSAGLLLIPTTASAQLDVPPKLFVGPLSNPRPEEGGLYVGFNFVYMRTNRPMPISQSVAIRGIMDRDGAISGTPGTILGSGEEALNTDQLRGPGVWQPGWDLWIGWKFRDGVAVELGWRHLVEARYRAFAQIQPPDGLLIGQLESTFFFAPVVNFGTDWAGASPNIPAGTPATTFGIWNAASLMSIEFIQRYDIYTLNARFPVVQTDNYRSYGLFGPRIVWIWERFKWRTVDADIDGVTSAETSAVYSNMVSNRMTGLHAGVGHDWYWGSTPIGAFAFEFDIEGGLYLDMAKTTAKYEREDRAVSSGRHRRINALVPSVEARAGIKWYPWEGISVALGYDVQTYFNTVASPRPIDFNLSTVDPEYRHVFFRWYHGLRLGVSFSF